VPEEVTTGAEVFALTDEQIVGLDAAEVGGGSGDVRGDAPTKAERVTTEAQRAAEKQGDYEAPGKKEEAGRGTRDAQPGMAEPQEPPEWLAARMKDPWHGEEAKELWDGKQRAETEAAAYREVFATPEDARALKEIYPGGAAEAKSAAERARALEEIDAAFYRGDNATRMGLAQRMMAENPAAFRAMVEVGVELLKEQPPAVSQQSTPEKSRSLAALGMTKAQEEARDSQTQRPMPKEVVEAYGEMERAANAELEKSVGAAIGRAMEQALPNLKRLPIHGNDGTQAGAPLQSRLAAAVREEVDSALKSDRELGEQVTRVLAGRRFDATARGQVVRLIDARAQQLVPGAVKRVVASWTDATLAARGKSGEQRPQAQTLPARLPVEASPVKTPRERAVEDLENTAVRRGRRLDYARLTDEEILGM